MIDADWFEILAVHERLIIGFSGGLDSTVLLHYFAQQTSLRDKLLAIHINHGLSSHAADWAAHCRVFSERCQVPFIDIKVTVTGCSNIEEQARMARYNAFQTYMKANTALITAHHQDDQAETFLLNLMRGSGISGLSAMHAVNRLAAGFLYRPFLNISRQSLHDYAKAHQLTWLNDPSNENMRFTRNFIRQQLLPLLEQRWPSSPKTLARTALLCQQTQSNLDALAQIDYPEHAQPKPRLALETIADLPEARQHNVLRYWLKKNKVRPLNWKTFQRLVSEVIAAREDACPEVRWDGMIIRRYQQYLYIEPAAAMSAIKCSNRLWENFPKPLNIPGLGTLYAQFEKRDVQPLVVEIRFRQGGEKMVFHGQTKTLKNLMQSWHIPPWQRNRIPLVFMDGQLSAVVGYGVADSMREVMNVGWVVSIPH